MARDVIILIPARLAATRLPGKPLADIAGKPMIAHVVARAKAARIGDVVVATDSEAVCKSCSTRMRSYANICTNGYGSRLISSGDPDCQHRTPK